MKCYRDLCKTHKTFRSRSEQADVATEISLQPWKAYGTDGCILFSDILTPFPAMGVDFDITEKEGPKMSAWSTMADVDRMKPIDPYKHTPFVAEALKNLRHEVGNKATVLGFVGLPYTLATYMVEGGSSKDYKEIKVHDIFDSAHLRSLVIRTDAQKPMPVVPYSEYNHQNNNPITATTNLLLVLLIVNELPSSRNPERSS